MDKITIMALQAIVRGLHRGGAITTASVADIANQLQTVASLRYTEALDAEGARELMILSDGIEADAADA